MKKRDEEYTYKNAMPEMAKAELTQGEMNFLMFLGNQIIDAGGKVTGRLLRDNEFELAERWNDINYIHFGDILGNPENDAKTHWVDFSDQAWEDYLIACKYRGQVRRSRTIERLRCIDGIEALV